LIPKLFDGFQWHSVALTVDIEKAFLMISISLEDQDVLRFRHPTNAASEILELRFTHLVFGLRPSPAILGSVISHHLNKYESQHGELASEIKNSPYINDLISGGTTIDDAFRIHTVAKQTMAQAGFNLRKWHSNSQQLPTMIQAESNQLKAEHNFSSSPPEPQVSSNSKFVVIDNTSQSKVIWDSNNDTFTFIPSELLEQASKLSASRRSLLRVTASIFDPLGLKMLF